MRETIETIKKIKDNTIQGYTDHHTRERTSIHLAGDEQRKKGAEY